MIFDKLPIESARTMDENGYLHVATSNITKEQVVPYMGDTIPGWEKLGLEPKKVYTLYRPAEELEKAAPTFNGLPLSLDHWDMDASNLPHDKIVGSLGTDAKFEAPYLTNSLTITDANAIKRVQSGEFRDISAGYMCDVEMTGGVFGGQSYDGVMRNIRGNHVALVREGRAGHDVRVADSAMKGGENMMEKIDWKKLAMSFMEALKNGGGELMDETKNQNPEQNPEPTGAMNTPPAESVGEAHDEEPVDVLADDVREKMKAAGLDPEDKAAQKAFLAGMAAVKPVEDENGMPPADKEETPATDAEGCDETGMAKDSAIVQDRAFYAGLYKAAEDVAPFVGKISNPFAFDSAAAIYKKALDARGVATDGVDPSAYGAMVSMLSRPTAVPQGAPSEDPINAKLMGIKSY